jgi:hypothetical protein
MAISVTISPAVRDAAIASLSQLLGDRLSTAESVRQQHGRDASYHPCVRRMLLPSRNLPMR